MKNIILILSCGFILTIAYALLTTQASEQIKQVKKPSFPWPPELNQPYPDLELIDQEGTAFKLSALKGKIILLEPIGMTCPACQAFAGGYKYGAFGNGFVGGGVSSSIEELLPLYTNGIYLPHRDIILVQLLLYDMAMGPPKPQDAKAWAEHFNMRLGHNKIVAVSPYDLRNQASYNLIPGFQLIDQDFVLRSDSTGHHPQHNLYEYLLPMVPLLLR